MRNAERDRFHRLTKNHLFLRERHRLQAARVSASSRVRLSPNTFFLPLMTLFAFTGSISGGLNEVSVRI